MLRFWILAAVIGINSAVYAQFNLHAGIRLGDPISSKVAPYDDPPHRDIPAFALTFEAGYRFNHASEIRLIYASGSLSKNPLLDPITETTFNQIGITPIYNFWRSQNGKYEAGLGLPISYLLEKTEWQTATPYIFLGPMDKHRIRN